MSLSKQERQIDRLSDLDFLGGHLSIRVAQRSPHARAGTAIGKFQSNIKGFFQSHIGKPADLKADKVEILKAEEKDGDEEQFQWQLLPSELRSLIVRKMPLPSRLNLAATCKDEREFVKNTKVECKLFVIDDLDRRTSNIQRYPDLHWMACSRPGRRFFVNFVCDWQHDIAICFCEGRRPFQGRGYASRVYWMTPGGKVKRTMIPGIAPYDLAVKTAAHFFSVITEDCKRSSIAMPGWPEEIFNIPELRNSYTIGSSYDNVESIHKTYDFFEPFSFDVYMHQTAVKYLWPFSFLELAKKGVKSWKKNRDKDRALCDGMLDKDLRILILHDSFVSQEKMREFIEKWADGEISDKFCWWAVSTHMPLDEPSLIDGLNVQFVEGKYGFKYTKRQKKEGKASSSVQMTTYSVESSESPDRQAVLIVRDNMVLFANRESAPEMDASGLITYKTRSGICETQF